MWSKFKKIYKKPKRFGEKRPCFHVALPVAPGNVGACRAGATVSLKLQGSSNKASPAL